MPTKVTRKSFFTKAASGAAAVTAAKAAQPPAAGAAVALDAAFSAPYPPHPVLHYPRSWFPHIALIPKVVMPYDVVISNRKLGPLRDINGGPDMRDVPGDATALMLFIFDPIPAADANTAGFTPLAPTTTMRFSDLGGGERLWNGFRHFIAPYAVTVGGQLYSITARLYVGPDAGAEWATAQSIIDNVAIPAQ